MQNQPTIFREKIGLKQMVNNVDGIAPIAKLSLKLQWSGQVYVIIVMHRYLLKEL